MKQKESPLHTAMDALQAQDPEIHSIIGHELRRQQYQLEMIASENFASPAVLAAQGSILTNKYAEGYPGKRYYNGCEFVDQAETLAIERAKKLFECAYANVQPHSGSQANQAVFLSLLKPGDTFLSLSLDCGGHLTHGSRVNMSGKWFHATSYQLDPTTSLIDMDDVRKKAHLHKPKLIIAGGSAYSRIIDFAAFRAIADEVGAWLLVDMAHFSGLVAGGVYPSPLPHAHIVTTTTHKTLRGPRGGMILSQHKDMGKKLNMSVFPGNQGGPMMHVIAAKAVAFQEALSPSFKIYAKNVVENAKALSQAFIEGGLDVVSGGTDSHVVLVDLRRWHLEGHTASQALERGGITCNKNGVPLDPLPPMKTSGLRFGSPACTTRGMSATDFFNVGKRCVDILSHVQKGQSDAAETNCRKYVEELCLKYPLYEGCTL